MFSSLKARYAVIREDGFTLTELTVAIAIAAVLAAIAIPVFLNAQKSVSSLDVKTGLVQAASLIEAEKGDNNQLYPVYMPNEVLGNSLWKTFSYAYARADRLSYCLSGTDSNGGIWYVSSSIRTPSSTSCFNGDMVLATNSATPWTIQFPNVDVSTYTLNWAKNASNPTGSVTWTNAQCNTGDTSYQLKLVNNTQGITIKVPTDTQVNANHGGLTTYSYSPDLTGWLPGDSTTASVAAICNEHLGSNSYTYPGSFTGASKDQNVPQFPLDSATYSSAPNSYYVENADKTLTMKVSATFNPITCPTLTSGISGVDTPVYRLVAIQGGTTIGDKTYSVPTDTSAAAAIAAQNVTLNLTGLTPDTKVVYWGYSMCQFQRSTGATVRVSGTDNINDSKYGAGTTSPYIDGRNVTDGVFTPVGFPTAPGTPTTVSTNNGVVKPDGLAWTGSTTRQCAYGGTLNYSYSQVTPGGVADSLYTTALTSGKIDWAQATTYKYIINAKCIGANRSSDATASAPVTFTTGANTPASSWATQYSTSYSSGQLIANGSLNTIACPNGSAVRYYVKASQSGENDVTYDGTSNSPTLTLNSTNSSNNGFDGDKLVTYTGYGYCRVTQFDNSTKDYAGTAATSTEYAAVANPAGTSAPSFYTTGDDPNTTPSAISWSGQSCPNGGSIQYQYVQTSPGNSTSGWTTSTSTGNLNWNPGSTYYYQINFRCVGGYRTSNTITGGNNNAYVNWNTPHTPSATSGVWTDDNGDANITNNDRVLWYSVGCDRGAQTQYFVRQVRQGNNYTNPNSGSYGDSGWITGTTYNVPAGWLRQGSNTGYQVATRCVNPSTGAASGYNWSGEVWHTNSIDNPGSTGISRNGDRGITWYGVGCGQGAYAQYLFQQYNHNQGQTAYGSAYDNGWGTYYSANVDGYNGYSQGVRVYTRCVGDNAVSGTPESNHIDYQIPVYAPRLNLTCKPGSTSDYSGYGGGNCDNITLGFGIVCGSAAYNPNWNGSSSSGSGIKINSATGLKASQLDNYNGDHFARHSGGTSGSGGGWGTWSANIANTSCVAGNGAGSGGVTWNNVLSSTGGGTTYN